MGNAGMEYQYGGIKYGECRYGISVWGNNKVWGMQAWNISMGEYQYGGIKYGECRYGISVWGNKVWGMKCVTE